MKGKQSSTRTHAVHTATLFVSPLKREIGDFTHQYYQHLDMVGYIVIYVAFRWHVREVE